MKVFWDERYKQEDYAYGESPNAFLKQCLSDIEPGKALFPAEGEGRNAVYAATLGFIVEAFDLSEEGKKKAQQLATRKGAEIHYQVGNLETMNYEPSSFDLIVLIFAHFPADLRFSFHQQLISYLKPGGLVIIEGFSQSHTYFQNLNANAGGPKDPLMLYNEAMLLKDFKGFETMILKTEEVELSEGKFHQGTASVVRYLGRKL
jgi:SAM-dependent methyltransferase